MRRLKVLGQLLNDDETLIRAISRVRTDIDGKIYRYYLGVGRRSSGEIHRIGMLMLKTKYVS